jgi:hypothetical protein
MYPLPRVTATEQGNTAVAIALHAGMGTTDANDTSPAAATITKQTVAACSVCAFNSRYILGCRVAFVRCRHNKPPVLLTRLVIVRSVEIECSGGREIFSFLMHTNRHRSEILLKLRKILLLRREHSSCILEARTKSVDRIFLPLREYHKNSPKTSHDISSIHAILLYERYVFSLSSFTK